MKDFPIHNIEPFPLTLRRRIPMVNVRMPKVLWPWGGLSAGVSREIPWPQQQIALTNISCGGRSPAMISRKPPAHGGAALRLATDAETKPIPARTLRPLLELLPEWERDMRVRLESSPDEIRKAQAAVREFVKHSGAVTAADLTPKAAIAWLTHRIETGGEGAKKTAKNLLSRIRGFAAFLKLEQQLGGEDPFSMVKLPSAPRRKGADPFTAEDVIALVEVAEGREANNRQARRNGPLASTLYRFMAHTGLRFKECKLQMWVDVDLEGRALLVSRDKARRNDSIPLSDEVCALLKAWRFFSRGEKVFPLMPSHHTLDDDMQAAKVAKQDAGRKGQWHRFRKCAITERAKRGAPLRELHKLARHSTVDMTMQHYDLAKVEELRAVADLMPSFEKLSRQLDNAEKHSHTGLNCGTTKTRASKASKKNLEPNEGDRDPARDVPQHDLTGRISRSPSPGSDLVGSEPAGEEWSRGESNPWQLPPPVTSQLIDRVTHAHKSYLDLCMRLAGELERCPRDAQGR